MDFGKKSADFHLGLIPQPYIGNLAEATVFLLMLNPGFSPGDYYAQEHSAAFQQARIANLKQENDDDYPFFYLNPQFAWTAGGQWWQNKLASVTKELAKHEKLAGNNPATAYRRALSHVSKYLACIELCPYFSKEYQEPRPKLESMRLALDYVQTELAARCQRDEAAVVVLRKVDVWGLAASENVFRLYPKHARGAHLTISTEAETAIKAGDFICHKLIKLLE